MRDHLAEIDAIGGSQRCADLRQHRRRVRSRRPAARPRQRAVPQPDVERDLAGAAGGGARHGAAARGARQPRLHARRAVRAHRCACTTRASASASTPSSVACSSASTSTSSAPARSWRRRSRRATPPIMERLAELTTRFGQNVLADESRVPARAARRGRSGRPARVRRATRRARQRASAASPTARSITLSRSHIVPFLTFSERRDLREQAWRAWTSRGEHDGASDNRAVAAEILAAAPRAGAPARPCELRRLRAQRHDGAQPGGGDVAARAGLAAGARRAPTTSARRSRRWRSRAARAPRSSRGTGASTPRRCARCASTSTRRRSSPTSRSSGWSRRRSTARRACSASRSSRAPTSPSTTPTSASTRCAARPAPIGLFLHDNFARPTKRSGAWMSSYRMQSRNGVRRRRRRCCRSSSTTTTSRRARPARRRCSASTTRARSSTSSATACTACSRTSPTSASRAPTCCAISSSCRRSCSSTGSRSPRC